MRLKFGSLCLFICATIALCFIEHAHADIDKIEIHPLESSTLTTQEFLLGKKNGKPSIIAGELRLPKTTGKEPLPAVVLLHGSGGIKNNVSEWSEFLNRMGVATFIPDTFSGRNIDNTKAEALSRNVNIVDAYCSLTFLAKHPRIDPKRIAVMGFSRGGRAALYASLKRFQRMHGPGDGIEFAAYIAFYPDCGTTFLEDDEISGKPIRIFHGSADDWNPIAPCRAYVERLRKKNKNVELIEYADAHHVFDNAGLIIPQKFDQTPTAGKCLLAETTGGLIINQATKQPFSLKDTCAERGVTMAYSAEAHTEAKKRVEELILDVLKP